MTTLRKLPTMAPKRPTTMTRNQLVLTAVPVSCRAVKGSPTPMQTVVKRVAVDQPVSESFAPYHISIASAISSGESVTLSTMWTDAD